MLKLQNRAASAFYAGFLLFLLFLAIACTGQRHRETGLLFKDWYVVRPMAAGAWAVAYGTVKNEGTAPATLQDAQFDCAAATELHETVTEGDRVRMTAMPQTSIAPGETLVFEPGHKHVMLQQVTVPAGEKCNVFFTFDTATARFAVPIKERKP